MTERPHKRLKIWGSSMELVEMTYKLTDRFPKSEQFGLMSQLRRAAISIPTNIAEGLARRSAKETLQFTFIARGSLSELDALYELSSRVGCLTQPEYATLTKKMAEVSSLLQGLIAHYQRRSL